MGWAGIIVISLLVAVILDAVTFSQFLFFFFKLHKLPSVT